MSFFARFKPKPSTELVVLEPPVALKVEPDPYERYDVVYFPYSGRYYPRLRARDYNEFRYLVRECEITGCIGTVYTIEFGVHFRTARGAWTFIDEMIVQKRGGVGQRIIKKHPLIQ